jgi:hypothetical protein
MIQAFRYELIQNTIISVGLRIADLEQNAKMLLKSKWARGRNSATVFYINAEFILRHFRWLLRLLDAITCLFDNIHLSNLVVACLIRDRHLTLHLSQKLLCQNPSRQS